MVRGKILFNYDNIADVDNRFTSITVELKLNQIK
jgi:hypothetical protein